MLGCNLLKLIVDSNFHGLPIRMVKRIIKQVLEGLQYLHDKCKIIHTGLRKWHFERTFIFTDLKLENVLITMSHEQVKEMARKALITCKTGQEFSDSAICSSKKSVIKVGFYNPNFELFKPIFRHPRP